MNLNTVDERHFGTFPLPKKGEGENINTAVGFLYCGAHNIKKCTSSIFLLRSHCKMRLNTTAITYDESAAYQHRTFI